MKTTFAILKQSTLALILCLLGSCSKDRQDGVGGTEAPLRMSVTFDAGTRLAELPNPGEMAVDKNGNGLYDVGVYIYYKSDYDNGDLSQPYVRNQRFTVQNGMLVASGATATDQHIYIYDQMTVVAFYPYNPDMSLPENNFTQKSDEENYPVTRSDYSEQFYIPYRAESNVDPTSAFYAVLNFYPKHTYKLEVVVVAGQSDEFPTSADVQLLPNNDPITTVNTALDGKREAWYDLFTEKVNDGSGSDIQVYTAYLWTRSDHRNEILQGDVLLKSDKLTLIASQDLFPNEQRVYRYGYNISTGEIFIPTSSAYVYDASTLAAVDATGGAFYQVCDIDISKKMGNWTPISLLGGRYDGGGHKISNMTVNSGSDMVGLFDKIQGNGTVANVNLVDPVITVTADNTYVGAIAGRVNTPMTEAEKQQLIGNLPEGLSEVVKEALIQEILANAGNSQSNIVACKVRNPVITVNGLNPHVGTIAGQAGEKTEAGDSKSRVWDTASIGGSVTVNSGNPANNENAYIGGFIGLNQGYVLRSFTSTASITAQANALDANNLPILVDKYTGFAYQGTDFTPAEGGVIEDCFSELTDGNNGVSLLSAKWPSWGTYTGIWPIEIVGWFGNPGNSFWYSNGSAPSTYPTLQWERR